MWYFIYWNVLNKIVNSENLHTSSTPERISNNKDLYLENIIWKYFPKLEISCRYEITCRRRQSIVFFIRNNLMVLYIFFWFTNLLHSHRYILHNWQSLRSTTDLTTNLEWPSYQTIDEQVREILQLLHVADYCWSRRLLDIA